MLSIFGRSAAITLSGVASAEYRLITFLRPAAITEPYYFLILTRDELPLVEMRILVLDGLR